MRLLLYNIFIVFLALLLFAGGCGKSQPSKTSPLERFTGGCRTSQPTEAPAKEKATKPGEQNTKPAPANRNEKVLFVVAPFNFRDEEYKIPREILEGKGYKVLVASASRDPACGAYGLIVKPDLTVSEANGTAFAAVIFVGGSGAKNYFNDAEAHRLAREARDAGRVVGAICIAPVILAEAGLLEGKKCTAYPSVKELLRAKGAVYSGEEVVVDGRIVTAKGPRSARHFGNAVAAVLEESG